jgi:hypothetical protein
MENNLQEFDKYRNQLTTQLAKKIDIQNNTQDSLIKAVENYKLLNPQKYMSAQLTGEHIMNSDYDLIPGIDKEGELITIKLLQQLINNGITEFTDDELQLLQKYNIQF